MSNYTTTYETPSQQIVNLATAVHELISDRSEHGYSAATSEADRVAANLLSAINEVRKANFPTEWEANQPAST